MRMGNKHSNRASSAGKPSMKNTSADSPPTVARNGSQRGGQGQSQPALAEAIAASAVTAAAAAGASSSVEIASSSSQASQLQAQHLADVLDSVQPIQLSAYQKHLLREAWQKINKKGSGSIGTLIFRRMFSKQPEIKQVFQHVTVIEGVFGFGLTPMQAFHQHSTLFVQVLDTAIEQLDDLRPFVKKCIEFGAKHAPYKNYGFKADMWDVFGECMTESAREWEGWRKHRETIRAWTILVSFIVDRMRQGYETAVRRQCFMQQLSTKQSAGSSVDAEDVDQVDQGQGAHGQGSQASQGGQGSQGQGQGQSHGEGQGGLNVQNKKRTSTTPRQQQEDNSPRRRLPSRVNLSQENPPNVASDTDETNEVKSRMARAESH